MSVGNSFKDETRLALFALERQAVAGSCKEPKPWGWNVVESAKWQAWSQLQDMAPVEAMRLYVRLLEDELVSHCCCQFLLHATSSEEDSSPQLHQSMFAALLHLCLQLKLYINIALIRELHSVRDTQNMIASRCHPCAVQCEFHVEQHALSKHNSSDCCLPGCSRPGGTSMRRVYTAHLQALTESFQSAVASPMAMARHALTQHLLAIPLPMATYPLAQQAHQRHSIHSNPLAYSKLCRRYT